MRHLLLNFSLLLLCTMCMTTGQNKFPDDGGRQKHRDPFQNMHFTFSCDGRPPGFYADVQHHCKIFHICVEDGSRLPVICPNKTLFDQRQRMCTDEEIPCEKSEKWYYLDSSNYYTYFMESKKKAEVILEEIEVDTVRPLEDN